MKPGLDRVALLVLPMVKFLIHLSVAGRYGYFRDEFYFMDCARHLDWGYADHAPLIAVWARIGMALGPELMWFRLPAVVAGALAVAVVVLIARELGGGAAAQRLAGLCMVIAPGVLGVGILLTMNVFEPLFWLTGVLAILRVRSTGDGRWWLLFGLSAGLGLMNKHSTLFFGAAVGLAVVLTDLRQELRRRWIYLGGLVAAAVFLPNIIWQAQHNFATFELLNNVRKMNKNVQLSPPAFVGEEMMAMNPLLAPIALAGLLWSLRRPQFRWLGVTWVALLVLFIGMNAKTYYFFPAFGMMFAAGAVGWMEHWQRPLARWGLVAAATVLTVIVSPLLLPILDPPALITYMDQLHLRPPKMEVAHAGPLPQIYGDQFGWRELVDEVAAAYGQLPEEERKRTGIFASNYGEAGAINFYGPELGLPRAVSAHQNYWFWGPGGYGEKGTNLIVLQMPREYLERRCEAVTEVVQHFHPFGMEEENRPVYYCRGLRVSLGDMWVRLKHWN